MDPSTPNTQTPPPPPTTAQFSDASPPASASSPPSGRAEEPGDDTIRTPKRQRKCVLADLAPLNITTSTIFSFTFDTKISDESAPDTTPKFGSFNNCEKAGTAISRENQIGEEEDDGDDKKRVSV